MIFPAIIVLTTTLVVQHCLPLENGQMLCPPPAPKSQRTEAERRQYSDAYEAAMERQRAILNTLTPEQQSRLPAEWKARMQDLNDGK